MNNKGKQTFDIKHMDEAHKMNKPRRKVRLIQGVSSRMKA